MNQNSYEVKSIDELVQLRSQLNGRFIYQDENNLAHIYKLQDGQIVLLPAIGKDGLLFANEEKLRNVLSNGYIPLEEENPNPFQLNREKIEGLNDNIVYFLNILSDSLNMGIDISNDDTSYYKDIDSRIRSLGYEKAYKDLFIPLGIFVGEKIKRKTSSQWKLKKDYGYNPYYIPELATQNRVYYPWYKLAEMLLERRNFNLEKYITVASVGFEK